MKSAYTYSCIIFLFFCLHGLSQETTFSALDSMHSSYHIVTLKDGTVLKGKIVKQEKRTIQFHDEIIGNITFRAKQVASIEKVEPQDYYLITMMNGTTLQGKITARKEKEIVVETSNIGSVTVDISKIKTIKAITPDNYKDGKYWFKTHIDAHYFITPSAIPLNSGELFYQNTMGVFNSFNIGITKNFSCMGGIVIPSVMFIAPQFTWKITNGVHAGIGGLFADITQKPYAGAAFGQISFGNRNSHLSIGGGYGFVNGIKKIYYRNKITNIQMGIVSIRGMKRFAPKYALVTENLFAVDEGFNLFSGGFRLMGEKSSWDFGFASISISRKITGNNFSLGPITFISYMRNL